MCLQQHGRSHGLGACIDLLLRCRSIGDALPVLLGGLRGPGGPLEDSQVAGPDAPRSVRYLGPQLEDPGEEGELLGVCERAAGIRCRAPGADQSAGGVVRVVPVVGLLNHRPAGCGQPGVGAKDLGEAGVQAGALAR